MKNPLIKIGLPIMNDHRKMTMKEYKHMKNIPHSLSEMQSDVTRCFLPQITQITQIAQEIICENLRNLRLIMLVNNFKMSMILTKLTPSGYEKR
jgi:hypothetical protein